MSASTVHNFICEGCLADVPMSEAEFDQEMDRFGRLLCEKCRAKRDEKGRARGARAGEAPGADGQA